MLVDSCIPVIPSADLEKSLRFWVDGLGLSMDRAMRQDGCFGVATNKSG
jgi:catechol 2,3-dioxygenase-like lactoylglutathione lyase family enzyme